MNRAAKGVFTLMVLQALWVGAAFCADPVNILIKQELKKQEEILRSNEAGVLENYTVDRNLEDYIGALAFDFDQTLARLEPRHRWMDIGAGRGQAILDYFSPSYDRSHPEGRDRRGGKARAVAISVEDRRTAQWHQMAGRLGDNQIAYFFDKRMRDFSIAELGRFHVITDMLGGFSYTDQLSVFMEKVLSFLELNGTFYTVLQDVNSENGSNRPFYANSPYLTELTSAAGSEVKVCSWLKSISCVEVSCELKPRWKPPIEIYRIQKVCNKVEVPALEQTHFQAGTPPERRFRLKLESSDAASPRQLPQR
jgi:hypothetical protein